MSQRIPIGFAEATVQFTTTGSTRLMVSSLGIDLAVGVGASQATTDLILNAMCVNLDNCINASWNVAPFKCVFGQDGGDVTFFGTGAIQAGDRAGSPSPPNLSLLVTKFTTGGGRRNKGRMFIPGVSEPDVDQLGIIASGSLATIQTSLTAMRDELVALAEVEQLVLLHNEDPFTPTPITALTAQSLAATQRRRMRGS